jgi:hypothetical protein
MCKQNVATAASIVWFRQGRSSRTSCNSIPPIARRFQEPRTYRASTVTAVYEGKMQLVLANLQDLQAAAGPPGASKLAHYLPAAWTGRLLEEEEYVPLPAPYLGAVWQPSHRVALAQLRTGSYWLGEETRRWVRVPRAKHTCPHCQGGLEDVQHALFLSVVLASASTLPHSWSRTLCMVAALWRKCQRTHAVTLGEGPAPGPAPE